MPDVIALTVLLHWFHFSLDDTGYLMPLPSYDIPPKARPFVLRLKIPDGNTTCTTNGRGFLTYTENESASFVL